VSNAKTFRAGKKSGTLLAKGFIRGEARGRPRANQQWPDQR
jgi:hypothetical protein